MFNKYLAGLVPVAVVVFSISAGSVGSTPREPIMAASQQEDQPTVASQPEQASGSEQAYIGTDRCFTCHRDQSNAWSETKHAQAFDNLPAKYRDDPSCLQCHVTAFGQNGGYVSGMPDDEAKPLLSVGCEVCHGPGAAHEEAVKRWTLSDPADEERLLKEIKTTIVRTPTDSQCAACHTTQSHQGHPPYEGQPLSSPSAIHSGGRITSADVVARPSPMSYSVKTCGSCHYTQYKEWRVGMHVDLSAGLPAKYGDDQDCLACHRRNLEPWDWYTPATDSSADNNQVGVGCESCHGPALKHVMFNKQFIHGHQLGPELEEAARQSIREGKPAAACMQCHIREGHMEHPQYESPDNAKSK